MRYPEFLQKNGRIGFIAPSFGCTTEPYRTCFKESLRRFRSRGYKTVLGPNCFRDDGVGKSSSPENCAAEINDFFMNDRCDVIISCGGGETMCEDLSFVDFEGIKTAKPKWYMGFSDNTNLTFTLPVLCDTAAIYGPCAPAFSMRPWHPSLSDALGILKGKSFTVSSYDGWEIDSFKDEENPFLPYNITEAPCMKTFNAPGGAAFSGRLLGGCLDSLSILAGTAFDKVREFEERYAEDGIIWFLESCDLNPMSIRRSLWQLANAGWFDTAKGFIIGRPYHFYEEMLGMDRVNAVTGILEKYNVPIVMDTDLGHLPPAMPLISGACADVYEEHGKLVVAMKLV